LVGKSVALGYVYGKERMADGTRLQVDLLGKKYDATVRAKAAAEPAAVRDRKAAAALASAVGSTVSPSTSSSQPTAAMSAAGAGKA